MAKEIKWENVPLTSDEVRTLNELRNKGKEVYAAPIEIEHSEQLESLGISWSQCRTWYIGNERITVHLTPSDEETYRFLLGELRARHRDEYRNSRCMVPGKYRLIRCPECNSCRRCPFPEYRDQRQPTVISWDEGIETQSRGMAELQELSFSYNKVSDISVIKNFRNLQEIWLADNPVEDYSPLEELPDSTEVHRRGAGTEESERKTVLRKKTVSFIIVLSDVKRQHI